ncbi:MAG: universal stress protein [Anaerolineales bacterium]|jgi:nucleotide-binding universal stress UspA family protein
MFKNILLAVDGSEHSLHAAKTAAELARNMNADILRIVVAFEPVPSYLGEPNMQTAISARMEEAETILQKAMDAVGEIPGEVHTEVLEGAPAEAILDVAKTRKSDLIVMGSRGLGLLQGALLGSQSQKVVRHAPCPVLIVR